MTFPQWFRCSALAVLLTTVTGCFTWQPYDIGATPVGSHDIGATPVGSHALPDSLRITRHDSSRVAVSAPFVRGDTLFGHLDGDTIAVPVPNIASVQRLGFSIVQTLGLVLVPAAALGVTYLIVCGERGCEPQY